LADPAPVCNGTTCTETFTFTGGSPTWTLPGGVTSATFDVFGAQGAAGTAGMGAGLGGEANATIAVTPGETLQINVGGLGSGGGNGGFNGGGNGSNQGGGGGGASDVRRGGFALADRIIVAGGGGGCGECLGLIATGGGGGGLAGDNGTSSNNASAGGGGGGTQTMGGTGGTAGTGGTTGGDGTPGAGGNGGGPRGAGGGGGGFFGGGGGGGRGEGGVLEGGTGGGGGSGFGPAGTVFQTGTHSGDGEVTITYAQTADLGLSKGASPNPVKSGKNVTFTITVHNYGPADANGVTVTDTLPAQTQFVSAETSQGSCTTPAPGQTGTVVCNQGSLASGATSTVQIVVKVVATKKSTVTNTATVRSSSPTDPEPANNSATVAVSVK